MPWGAATSTGARWVHRPGGRTSDVGTGSALSHSFAHPVGGRGGSSGLPGVTVHTRSGSACARPMRPALSSSGRARSAHWSSLAHIEVELVPSVPEQQRPTRLCCRHSTTAVGFGVMGGSQARGSTLGVSLMRITIDTREDRFEDALGVLRRAYGRHRLPRKPEESGAVPEAVDLSSAGALAEESDNRSPSGTVRGEAGSRKPSAKGRKSSATKRRPAITAAAESPVSTATVKRASGKKSVRPAPTPGRPGASRKRPASGVAVNVAPRGQSEAVRAWAQEQGMQVRTRGRMPAKVISAYLEAHNE